MSQENGGIQSVQRSFVLLEYLARLADGATIRELVKGTSLPKSTVHRLLQNLILLGYVRQNEQTARYYATLKLFALASETVDRIDAVSVARPYMDSLAAQSGLTVHLVVREETDVVYVYKAEAGSMRMSSRLGLRIPLYCTGVGKAILATLPHAQVQHIWQQSKVYALTPHTITTFEGLEKELATVRRRGWALDDEENEVGIRCVAAALPAVGNMPDTAFSLSGLAARIDAEQVQRLAALCLETRRAVLQEMGLAGL